MGHWGFIYTYLRKMLYLCCSLLAAKIIVPTSLIYAKDCDERHRA